MATNLKSTPDTAPMRKLFGKIAGMVQRHQSQYRPSSGLRRAASILEWATHANQKLGPTSDRRPRSPVLRVTSLGTSAVEPGLAAIRGWAISVEEDFPEGIVEAALDDEDVWEELSNRVPCEGSTTGDPWKSRCGFQAALNTFLLSNGVHRIRLRVKTRSGQVAAAGEVAFRVNHVGRLAETTTRLIKSASNPERIWVDLIDSSDFPFDLAATWRGSSGPTPSFACRDRGPTQACLRHTRLICGTS